MEQREVRGIVREHYDQVAQGDTASCAPGCCAVSPEASLALGYSEEDLAAVPDGANLGLGCGNPQTIAELQPGETVLDLGSGAGFDALLASARVGPKGRVIGVDMTASMIEKARANAEKAAAGNTEFRLGEIEHLPVADGSVDVVISNCVINLSPDKPAVFRDAFRVLVPGGRIAISDVVLIKPLPERLAENVAALAGCVAGAATLEETKRWLADAGFTDVKVDVNEESRTFIGKWLPDSGVEEHVAAARITARRPTDESCCESSCCA